MSDLGYHAWLIQQFGGTALLADHLGVSRPSTTKWPTRGIPHRLWHRVIALAAATGIGPVTAEQLEATKPPGKEEK